MPAQPTAVDIEQLTGVSADKLRLMPACQYEYRNGMVTIRFKEIEHRCTGPECRQAPISKLPGSDMALPSQTSGGGGTAIPSDYFAWNAKESEIEKLRVVDTVHNLLVITIFLRPPAAI